MLVLFDIDGTLVRGASRAHASALRQALNNVHGVSVEGIKLSGSAAGRTDGEIARLYLLEAGISAERIDERAADVREECCRLYSSLCPSDLTDMVVEGIPELLESLSGRDEVTLSLVTGNFEPVARLKLKAAGIGHWFARGQGGFGSDSEDRTMLPPIARRRAGEAAGHATSWPRKQTIVIGDTPRDIACAHADDVRCIAVTTGPHAAGDLTDAEYVVDDTQALAATLESLASA
ncbi:MAG TPA: haloacid dehalogenase-like hydrolase [Solirubrobacteraceae bacterium]|jgi:phosphoglycolate phosphatase-like HAD superfamily hydrolase|nr:haloacid dehalogenase-like hydrolase [Solirubrobacteraceae bacterium]